MAFRGGWLLGRVSWGCRARAGHPATRWATTSTSTSPSSATHPRDDDYIQRVLTSTVYDVCVETPLQRAGIMSRALGADVFLKREDLQPVFSFKLRGAYNKIKSLGEGELAKGVVTCSAGG